MPPRNAADWPEVRRCWVFLGLETLIASSLGASPLGPRFPWRWRRIFGGLGLIQPLSESGRLVGYAEFSKEAFSESNLTTHRIGQRLRLFHILESGENLIL